MASSNLRPSYKDHLQKSPLLLNQLNTSRLPRSIATKLISDREQRRAKAFRMYGDPKAAESMPRCNNYLAGVSPRSVVQVPPPVVLKTGNPSKSNNIPRILLQESSRDT